jgi:hypothetical protein
VAAVISGLPSTGHALVTGQDPLEASVAAGSLLLRRERRPGLLLVAAIPVHLGISAMWGVLLSILLPRRGRVLYGAVGGLIIAAFDLGVIGRRIPRIRNLPLLPQLADHVLYGATVGAVLDRGAPGAGWTKRSIAACRPHP